MTSTAARRTDLGYPASAPRATWRRGPLEALLVLASPGLAVLLLQERFIYVPGMIDPWFYQAHVEHGPELVSRFGPDYYQWVRFGVTIPGNVTYVLFGAVPGYIVFHYALALVAVVPAYLLFRRTWGRGAGALVVAALLANPVIVTAWGTDYPDGAVISYLVGGTSMLYLAVDAAGRRVAWLSGAGVMFSLAVHSQVVSVPLVMINVLVVLAVQRARRRPVDSTLGTVAVLLLWFVVVTTAITLYATVVYHRSDIWTPTLESMRYLRSPKEIHKWHSFTNAWVADKPFLLVPPMVGLAALATIRLPTPRRSLVAALATTTLAQFSFFAWAQFAHRSYTLEYYFWSSQLWAATTLTMAALLVVLSAESSRGTARRWCVLALLAVPYVLSLPRPRFHLPVGAALAMLVLAALAVAAARRSRAGGVPIRRGASTAVSLALATLVIAGTSALETSADVGWPRRVGQVAFPNPPYGSVIRNLRGVVVSLDQYGLASQLHEVVPDPTRRRDELMMWWSDEHGRLLNPVAAQFLWNRHALPARLPHFGKVERERLDRTRPPTLLLLGPDDRAFPAALAALVAADYHPRVVRRSVLRRGPLRAGVWVVALDRGRRRPATGHGRRGYGGRSRGQGMRHERPTIYSPHSRPPV